MRIIRNCLFSQRVVTLLLHRWGIVSLSPSNEPMRPEQLLIIVIFGTLPNKLIFIFVVAKTDWIKITKRANNLFFNSKKEGFRPKRTRLDRCSCIIKNHPKSTKISNWIKVNLKAFCIKTSCSADIHDH